MRHQSRRESVVARVVALGAALALAAVYPLAASSEPLGALRAFFLGPFSSSYAFFGLLESAAPLLFCALGAAFAFRAGIFNLGGEGQAAVGALAAALTVQGLDASALPPPLVLVVAIAAAGAAGSALALLSTAAELWSGAEVLLTSFLVSQAALIAVDWAIGGPLKAASSNLPGLPPIPRRLLLPRLAPPSNLSLAAPLALVAAAFLYLAMDRSRAGY
ncbi:MAG: hypothetical protein M0Z80_03140, partial [Treponema sp.]|nr:hypothetical protein [Treponema sp.]